MTKLEELMNEFKEGYAVSEIAIVKVNPKTVQVYNPKTDKIETIRMPAPSKTDSKELKQFRKEISKKMTAKRVSKLKAKADTKYATAKATGTLKKGETKAVYRDKEMADYKIRKEWEKVSNEKGKYTYTDQEGKKHTMTYKQFKNRIETRQNAMQKEYDKTNKTRKTKQYATTSKALKKELNSTTFKPVSVIGPENLLSGIKNKFPAEYNQIKEFCKTAKGTYKSVKSCLKEYDETTKNFIFENGKGEQIAVSLEKSPEQLIITQVK